MNFGISNAKHFPAKKEKLRRVLTENLGACIFPGYPYVEGGEYLFYSRSILKTISRVEAKKRVW